jgi:IgA Peptidase M64/Peptidase M64 N-terminus
MTHAGSALALLALLAASPGLAAPPRTFRLDYFHTGTATEERFAVDRLVLEPLPFPGNPARPIDDTNRGKYLFEVRDLATNRVLYSRGFSSIYGEWEDTDEARRSARTFSESLRFPAPGRPVQVVVKKRAAGAPFREVWSTVIDPGDREVDDARPPSPGPVLTIQRSGDPADKLDLLLVGDGYTAADYPAFEKAARRLTEALFEKEPFRSRRGDFNVWGLCPPAEERGVSRPLTGQHRRTRVGTTYGALGSERYLLSFENRSLRDVASFAPYDALVLVANSGTYGGGGIFGLYATVAADNRWASYIFVHELGHHLADLADEYFTSDPGTPASDARPEPWEPNVTADPRAAKWGDLLTPGTPLPTPWPKDLFTRRANDYQERRRRIRAEGRPESEMDALFLAQQKEETELLGNARYAAAVGAFEGASYQATGLYRPQADCVMFSRDPVPFCAVCRRALGTAIDLYVGK